MRQRTPTTPNVAISKPLNEIAKILAIVDNTMEREIYIEKIASGYNISKEAIYAEVNKLTYKNDKSEKILEKAKPIITHKKVETKEVSQAIKRRENAIISILLSFSIVFLSVSTCIPISVCADTDKTVLSKSSDSPFAYSSSEAHKYVSAHLDIYDSDNTHLFSYTQTSTYKWT